MQHGESGTQKWLTHHRIFFFVHNSRLKGIQERENILSLLQILNFAFAEEIFGLKMPWQLEQTTMVVQDSMLKQTKKWHNFWHHNCSNWCSCECSWKVPLAIISVKEMCRHSALMLAELIIMSCWQTAFEWKKGNYFWLFVLLIIKHCSWNSNKVELMHFKKVGYGI